MADDNSVEISFSAATDDALAGIQEIRSALSDLMTLVRGLDQSATQLNNAITSALPANALDQAAKNFSNIGTQAGNSAAQIGTVNGQIKLMQQELAQTKIVLNAEASQFQITQNQKFATLEAETQKEYDAQLKLLQQEAELGDRKTQQYGQVLGKIALLEQKHNIDMIKLDEQAIAQQQQMWNIALGTIETAFNSQLRGLLAGTTSWSQAFKNILGDVIIKFIEMCEQMVVKWLAAELAQTTASTSGAAARAAAQQTGAASGILANAANALQAIMTDAAQTFAGVFAFLAPTMGPAAAGPAAAAQASVSAAAIFDVGTDYVVRGGLALIHPGETIIPAARGSGPYTGANMSPQIHAPVSINVSALDSQSVARFFNDNSRHMLRAINDAVKRGAHIGLRAIHP
jgi:hypothetical protein